MVVTAGGCQSGDRAGASGRPTVPDTSYRVSFEKGEDSKRMVRVQSKVLDGSNRTLSQKGYAAVHLWVYEGRISGSGRYYSRARFDRAEGYTQEIANGLDVNATLSGRFSQRVVKVPTDAWKGNTLVITFDPDLARWVDKQNQPPPNPIHDTMRPVLQPVGQILSVPIVLILYIFNVGGIQGMR
jgi:hypothetical protein